MKVYADTSWWLSYKCRNDLNHKKAISLFDIKDDYEVIWTEWHKVEVFNSLRQAERAKAIEVGGSSQIVSLLEQEVRFGYWPYTVVVWKNAVKTADNLSKLHGFEQIIRAMDLFHVAIAVETRSDLFLTFDTDQKALAQRCGLECLSL